MAKKKIEKLYLHDLKLAFNAYLDSQLVPQNFKNENWRKFYNELKKYCSVVETQ